MTDTAPACVICMTGLYDDELDRQACRPCIRRTDENLLALAGVRGLYAQLGRQLAPGSGSGGPVVSGSRSAPIPVRLEPLSLLAKGGVVTILQTWVDDWADHGRAQRTRGGTLQQQLDAAVSTLRFNLDWASAAHPAFVEFAAEIWQIRRQCEGQISGERQPRRIGVACPCGQTLRITLDTDVVDCPACCTRYGHTEALSLPLAERAAA
ncbi:hypothetical protein [Streptomyces sp. PKU-EA00015]|uniref:hypothetical protein n=1 Tax=Streptomyces sp. PKU-EA00015 TaxID=2748326 RepID=UPI002810B2F7|nr:hypothetical protein [Streptomyces sp. PKU-EA00015]